MNIAKKIEAADAHLATLAALDDTERQKLTWAIVDAQNAAEQARKELDKKTAPAISYARRVLRDALPPNCGIEWHQYSGYTTDGVTKKVHLHLSGSVFERCPDAGRFEISFTCHPDTGAELHAFAARLRRVIDTITEGEK